MTNSELDLLLKKILEDAIDAENEDSNSNLCFSPSLHYQKQIRSMLNNPLAWVRRESTSIWKISLRYAAIFLLVSISITPVGTTEKMWDGSISIWGDGYYETNGDAKPE